MLALRHKNAVLRRHHQLIAGKWTIPPTPQPQQALHRIHRRTHPAPPRRCTGRCPSPTKCPTATTRGR